MKYSLMSMENLEFPSGSFDCVVDTFGLCSAEDPSKALQVFLFLNFWKEFFFFFFFFY